MAADVGAGLRRAEAICKGVTAGAAAGSSSEAEEAQRTGAEPAETSSAAEEPLAPLGCPLPGAQRTGAEPAETSSAGEEPLAPLGCPLPGAWAVAGDLLWDGVADAALPGLCVVVRGDRIHSLRPVAEVRRAGVPLDRREGCCLLPGLIDAHIHMEFSEDYALHEQPCLTRDELLGSMAERALRMLRGGITTARDLGGRDFAALRLRDEILAGRLQGPRLVCAGQPLTTPKGHCHQWGGGAASLQEAKAVVQRQAKHGVDWIKVMATGGMRTPGTDVRRAQFSADFLREVVAEAEALGLPVAAHAHGSAGVAVAVAAGCRTVEHCTWIGEGGLWGTTDDEVVQEMARRGVRVAPTAHARWKRRPMGDHNYQRMSGALRQLRRAGVPVVASSDAGAIPSLRHEALPGGVAVLADMAGLSPVEALRAATSSCAEAICLGEECGRLAPGFAADLLLVAGDPTRDLAVLRRPCLVVARGRFVEPAAPPAPGAAGRR